MDQAQRPDGSGDDPIEREPPNWRVLIIALSVVLLLGVAIAAMQFLL